MRYQEVPTRYLLRLLEVVEECGYDSGLFIDRYHISREALKNKDQRIASDVYLSVVDDVLEQTRIEGLGLRTGLKTPTVDHGILGYAVLASANLRRGIQIFSQYQRIQGPLVNLSLHQDGSDAVVRFEEIFPLGAKYRFAIADSMAEFSHTRNLYAEGIMQFTLAKVTYPEPAHSAMYRDILGCKVLFEQDANELRFSAAVLDIPFSLADASVAELCARQCEDILRQISGDTAIVDDVQRALLHHPGSMPDLEAVADKLHLSTRTLRRRLQEAGTSFGAVLTGVRMGLAVEYLLNTRLPPKEISYLVGYSDVTAFHRAFKKQFGVTPKDYRRDAAPMERTG